MVAAMINKDNGCYLFPPQFPFTRLLLRPSGIGESHAFGGTCLGEAELEMQCSVVLMGYVCGFSA